LENARGPESLIFPERRRNVDTDAMQVLDGVRVVEWTEAMAGPYAAMLLGDLGADVIKVERRGTGDQSRTWGPPFAGTESTYFLSANRNKRSLTLDINCPQGLGILRRLIGRADVFLHNQPGQASVTKRGLDYPSLAKGNPRLIYCAISGYGMDGPDAGRPGYDILAQGEAGVMSFTGEPGGEPVRYPVPIADISCGIFSAMGILAALLARAKTGRGQMLDMSLLDSQVSWLTSVGSSFLNAGVEPSRLGNAHPSIVPYQLFATSDERHIIVAVGTEALWGRFCGVLEIAETIGRDPRFASNRLRIANRRDLIPSLESIMKRATAEDWLRKLRAAAIPAGPIRSVSEALNDPQMAARRMVVEIEHAGIGLARSIANPMRMSGTPVSYRLPPPVLGEHSEAILAEVGLSAEEVSEARASGVV
jgi:crotonobetainyl-CoA:carnitine CoA-transferase CaiB-like acyl-CoA transferase